MRKGYLLAPGPTPVPPRVLAAMSLPIIHHRTPQFEAIVRDVQEGLKYLFQTTQDVLVLAASGTGAMEASVSNLFSPGDKALVVKGGKFGERWENICKAYGLTPVVIDVEWGKAVDPSAVKKALDSAPDIKGVFIQACETSTTVAHPVMEIAEIVAPRPDTLLVVDAISALGAVDLPMDRWRLDVLITGSQKALMLPPGLAMIALSAKAWSFAEKSRMPRFYFDLRKEKKNLASSTTAYTPAISLIIGLRESLAMIREEGLEAVFARHHRLAEATRAAVKALGFKPLAPDAPADSVTGFFVPAGVDGGALNKRLRDGYGVTMAGGQDHLKGKIMRLAHLGYVDTFDVIVGIAAVELALAEMGHPVAIGAGVKAASQVFVELGV